MDEKDKTIIFRKKGEKIHESLKPYLKSAFIFKEAGLIKVYDENCFHIGDISLKNKKNIDLDSMVSANSELPSEDVEKVSNSEGLQFVEKQKEGKVFVDSSLKFNLSFDGQNYASKVTDGFFLLYDQSGRIVFEYFTPDAFSGFDEQKKCLMFKDVYNGIIYGKGLDGRRFEISPQHIIQNPPQPKATEIQETDEKKEIKPELSPGQAVGMVIDRFRKIIKRNRIKVNYFIIEKLDNPDLDRILLKVLKGNLSELNEDIKKDSVRGTDVKIPPGFSSVKAALLHELFINSTLAGRGGHRGTNMRVLIKSLIVLDKFGKFSPSKKMIAPKVQSKGVEFFNQLSQKFKSKADIIHRVYFSIKNDDEYKKIVKINKDIDLDLYKAFLIGKLYEYTTRIDRGNGVVVINVSKAIMDVG